MPRSDFSLNLAYQPTTKRFADQSGPDFFPTPSWATKALLENEEFVGNVWECACGDGSMAEVIRDYGHNVYASDLFDRGYGESGIDFLETNRVSDNIITNPPYNLAESFIDHGLPLANKKFALLLRLAFLESAKRFRSIFSECPPSRIWVFSERITFYPNGKRTGGSGTTAYAWFVWDREHSGPSELSWLPPIYKR
jgi:hypothetical protein